MTAETRLDGADQSSTKAWRVHAFGAPENMIFEQFLGHVPLLTRCSSKYMRLALAHGTLGSERERVRYLSLFLSRSGRIWLVRLLPLVQGLPT